MKPFCPVERNVFFMLLWREGFPTEYWLFMKSKYLLSLESSSPLEQLLHKYLPQAGKYGTAPIGQITEEDKNQI